MKTLCLIQHFVCARKIRRSEECISIALLLAPQFCFACSSSFVCVLLPACIGFCQRATYFESKFLNSRVLYRAQPQILTLLAESGGNNKRTVRKINSETNKTYLATGEQSADG